MRNFILSEVNNALAPRTIAVCSTIDEALAEMEKRNPMHVEADRDNADCYDAITESGTLLMIEPSDRLAK